MSVRAGGDPVLGVFERPRLKPRARAGGAGVAVIRVTPTFELETTRNGEDVTDEYKVWAHVDLVTREATIQGAYVVRGGMGAVSTALSTEELAMEVKLDGIKRLALHAAYESDDCCDGCGEREVRHPGQLCDDCAPSAELPANFAKANAMVVLTVLNKLNEERVLQPELVPA